MNKKLIVLSFDALQTNDLEQLKHQPYFSKILKNAAIVKNIKEVYPTLTYPIHTTMVTGVYPDTHGIFHNQKSSILPKDPDWSLMGSDWYWYKKHIKVPTLMDKAFEDGLSVATVLWPVTAGEKRFTNVPEIWPVRGLNEDVREVYHDASSEDVMTHYFDEYIAQYHWKNNEDMVVYSVDIALDILRNQKPDLLMCHVIHLDHARHVYGVEGKEVEHSLRELDMVAGRFIKAARDAGVLQETNFVILGDHGQINIEKKIFMNKAFQEAGLIQLDKDCNVLDYSAYSFSAGFSTHIILKCPEDKALYQKVYNILLSIKKRYPKYIEGILTKDEALAKERLQGDFSFVVEGTIGTLFANEINSQTIAITDDCLSPENYKGMHGHHPDKGNKPVLVAFGPDILSGVVLETGNVIDVCPTLATLCGVTMDKLDGTLMSIIKQ